MWKRSKADDGNSTWYLHIDLKFLFPSLPQPVLMKNAQKHNGLDINLEIWFKINTRQALASNQRSGIPFACLQLLQARGHEAVEKIKKKKEGIFPSSQVTFFSFQCDISIQIPAVWDVCNSCIPSTHWQHTANTSERFSVQHPENPSWPKPRD